VSLQAKKEKKTFAISPCKSLQRVLLKGPRDLNGRFKHFHAMSGLLLVGWLVGWLVGMFIESLYHHRHR
jgi:hypothetical protein